MQAVSFCVAIKVKLALVFLRRLLPVFVLAAAFVCFSGVARATVPALPEVREILGAGQVKIDAGHTQHLRLGEQVAVVRDGVTVAYARISSLGEDWAVMDITRMNPLTLLQAGDQVRAMNWQATLPLGLTRPLLHRADPKERGLIDELLSTDVDHGLETTLPETAPVWSVPQPTPEVLARTTLSETTPAAKEQADIAPTEVSWIFTLDYISLGELKTAVEKLGYGQRIRLNPHASKFPEDQGKTLVRVDTLGEDLLGVVARLIRRIDTLPPQTR